VSCNQDFVAVDVETANADMGSICQIGIARYEGGSLSQQWNSYVDPEDIFDPVNISIHGIDEGIVRGAPKLPDIASRIQEEVEGRVVVCHTHFDRIAIRRAYFKYGLSVPGCTWLDSACVARRAWDEFARRGYGLQNVCETLGYKFAHHDALEDAKAAAHVILAAMSHTGLDVNGWLTRVRKPIDLSTSERKHSANRLLNSQSHRGSISQKGSAQEGNPEGPLYGEVLVFTGALTIPREGAAALAARIGCTVANAVTKRTTMLVVGDQDVRKLGGHERSAKHRKAEALILKGQPMRILAEGDFKELVRMADARASEGV